MTMKKLIALLLALMMLAGLCACTNNDGKVTTPTGTAAPTGPSEPSEPSEPTDPSEPSQPVDNSGSGLGATGGFGERPQ